MKKVKLILITFIAFNSFAQSQDLDEKKTTKLYEGEQKSTNEVGILCKGSGFEHNGGISHFNVEVENPLKKKKMKTLNYKKCIELLPGMASADVTFTRYGGLTRETRKAILVFKVEAGHNYTIHGSSGPIGGGWVVDRTTNKIVDKGGEIPEKFFSSNPSISE